MPSAKQRIGFPTQKPKRLLERVVLASSNKGDLVLDPFCGCGTTVAVAEQMERRWIGIDIAKVAVDVIEDRLARDYGPEIKPRYEVRPEPASAEDAFKMADEDKHIFQDWALRRIGAYSAPHKKGKDKGIDGRMYYHDHIDGETKLIVVSVKGGATGPAHVRDLRGVMEREKASLGVFVTRRKPTTGMREEAAEAGTYFSDGLGRMVQRLQIITVEDLFDANKKKRPVDFPAEAALMPGTPAQAAPPEVQESVAPARPPTK
ncbi:MAG: DNA methyltransferase [bacterium]